MIKNCNNMVARSDVEFGRLVKKARISKEMTQREVGSRLRSAEGVPRSSGYVSAIERGAWIPRDKSSLKQLSEILDIPEQLVFHKAGRVPPLLTETDLSDNDILEIYACAKKRIR